tara:strand:- start:2185 stop:3108 length:924 start_codon:yes stop_codon:yes gene_type:complete
MSDELEEGTASIASDVIPNPDSFGEVGEFGHDIIDDSDTHVEEVDDSGEPDFVEGDEGELVDEEPSDNDIHDPESKSYREMQSMYSKTQNEKSELEGQLSQIEDRLSSLGGLENVVQALTYVQTDPDYQALTAKKAGQSLPGVNDADLTPEAKEALDLVRKTVQAELRPVVSRLQREQIAPLADQIRQSSLNDIADSLLENYGEQFQEQLPTIERLAKSLPREILNNPTYKTMESLFHDSLREDGKAEAYYLSGYQDKVTGKRSKVTGSPKGGRADSDMPKFSKPKTMFDAARIADKKASYSRRRKR